MSNCSVHRLSRWRGEIVIEKELCIMKFKNMFIVMIMAFVFTSCESGFEDMMSEANNTGLKVMYNGNGYTNGLVPSDRNYYQEGDTVTIKNSYTQTAGNLVKIEDTSVSTSKAYYCSGWSDGTNIYNEGATITVGTSDIILTAQWTAYVVGDTGPAGGKIFYDAGSYRADLVNPSYGSWRYLEAPPADLGTCTWGVSGDSIAIVADYNSDPLLDKGPGLGKSNTALIVAQYPSGNYAANICDNYSLNGYDDWFLPAFRELMALQALKLNLSSPALNLNYTVFVSASRYWVSSPYGSDDTRGPLYRFDSAMWSDTRTNPWRVVPIRRF